MTATRTGLGRSQRDSGTGQRHAVAGGNPLIRACPLGESIDGWRQDEEGSVVTRPGDEVSGIQRRRGMALTSSLLTTSTR
jgi:hypothetical protein